MNALCLMTAEELFAKECFDEFKIIAAAHRKGHVSIESLNKTGAAILS